MEVGSQANYLAGEWLPAQRGARFRGGPHLGARDWPQSGLDDIVEARRALQVGGSWGVAARAAGLRALARGLLQDDGLRNSIAERFQLEEGRLGAHFEGLEQDLETVLGAPPAERGGLAWLAHDWSELVRAPLLDLARAVMAGHGVLLLSDERLPELGQAFARAAAAADFPPHALALLHGMRRELLGLALGGEAAGARAGGEERETLLASGRVEDVVALRRLCTRAGIDEPRLRALRAGTFEVNASDDPDACAAEVCEAAFGHGLTLGGQLPGALARVYCVTRHFSRFSEALLERLEALAGLPELIDARALGRVRAAWELGLDEGATCIFGGEQGSAGRVVPATVFTNVEEHMLSARRRDPLPVLCLLRTL